MRSIEIKAPAKVNTFLKVLGRRPDGYHDLEMVMVPLSLADEIEVRAADSGIELHLDGEADAGMSGGKNLAWRAAAALRDAAGVDQGAVIRLRKRTPVAAGLGGGSSDAAAVLKGLNALWGLNLPAERLAAIGARLGADVPFFCHGGPAYVEGMGDRVTPCGDFPSLAFLLVNPGFAVSTAWVYRQWDLRHALSEIEGLTHSGRGASRARPLFKAFSDVISSLHNDLEAVTIPEYPEIARIKEVLIEAGAAGALMSGSGPTVFGVFEDVSARDLAFERLAGVEGCWRLIAAEGMVARDVIRPSGGLSDGYHGRAGLSGR